MIVCTLKAAAKEQQTGARGRGEDVLFGPPSAAGVGTMRRAWARVRRAWAACDLSPLPRRPYARVWQVSFVVGVTGIVLVRLAF